MTTSKCQIINLNLKSIKLNYYYFGIIVALLYDMSILKKIIPDVLAYHISIFHIC